MTRMDDDQSSDDLVDDLEDVVEGEAELGDLSSTRSAVAVAEPDDGPTLGQAVTEYFARESEREKRRSNRAKSSANARRNSFTFDDQARIAVSRFRDHFGKERRLSALVPKMITDYQEVIGEKAMDLEARLQPVKVFLRFCKDQDYTSENLGNHLRIRRSNNVSPNADRLQHEEAQTFQMTAEGLELLIAERSQLESEMPDAVAAVAAAREDKDIRENAPLEAAREYQERLKGRIDELAYQITHAEVRDSVEPEENGRARLGSRVSVVEIDGQDQAIGQAREYTLVGTTEANAAARRISIESPLGRGLLGQSADRQIEIEAPSGRKRFRLLEVSD